MDKYFCCAWILSILSLVIVLDTGLVLISLLNIIWFICDTKKIDFSNLISTILNGTNYVIWTKKMINFLKGWKLWHYVTSDISQPIKRVDIETSSYIALLEECDNKNYQIITWFRNTCVPIIKLQFGHLRFAKEV